MAELARESIILRKFLDASERGDLYSRHRRGELVQLHAGAYVNSELWNSLNDDARHRALAQAVAAHFGDALVFSHLTAAALWRLPRVGNWPHKPHLVGPKSAGVGGVTSFVRHAVGVPSTRQSIDGVLVTTLGATVVDVAASVGFAHGVVLADAALRRAEHAVAGAPLAATTREELRRELARIAPTHGAVKASRVVEFADGRADRPGESLSRVSMRLAHVPPPELQVRMVGASGRVYFVDFWWEEFNLIGEFDGKYKYTDPEILRGRSPQQVVYEEKLREDDLRAADHRFSRWPWTIAVSPALLKAHLATAGVN